MLKMKELEQERFGDFHEVTQLVTKWIWSPFGNPSGLRPIGPWIMWPGLHQSDVPVEESRSEIGGRGAAQNTCLLHIVSGGVQPWGCQSLRFWCCSMFSVFGESHGVSAQGCCQWGVVFHDTISLHAVAFFLGGYLYTALFGCLGDFVD